MPDATTRTLVFTDRRQAGTYAVRDVDGLVVALIHPGRGGRFVVSDPTGAELCVATAGRWGLSNTWRVTGQDQAPMLEMRKHSFRPIAQLHLERGGEFTVAGGVWKRDFVVRDADKVVLSAVPRTSPLSLHPYEYAVNATDQLTSIEVIAVVQIWRALRKRDDATAAAVATTTVIAGT